MVEFGLKLEDNKVSEWGEHYLDYEGLKKILKKAKKLQQKYEELCSENPDLAKTVTTEYRTGAANPTTSSDCSKLERGSTKHKNTIQDNVIDEDEEDGQSQLMYSTERTALLKRKSRSTDDTLLLEAEAVEKQQRRQQQQQQQNTSSLLRKSISNLSLSVFAVGASVSATSIMKKESKSTICTKKLRNALVDIDEQTKVFDKALFSQQKTVVSFYYSQLQELQHRLEDLVGLVTRTYGEQYSSSDNNSVGTTGDEKKSVGTTSTRRRSGGGGTITGASPFPPTHRKLASSMMGQKVEELLYHITDSVRSSNSNNNKDNDANKEGDDKQGIDRNKKNKTGLTRKISVRPSHIRIGKKGTKFHLQSGDDDHDDNEVPWEEARIAEAEGIRMSLIDQYRVAKLLHNYSIMNITGFVKIIKKFNKSVTAEKDRYKETLRAQHMLNNGKAVDVLSAKYEKYYANWFCDGDMIEAKAQMLTKRGDGLDMDWSQLQLGYRFGMCTILLLWLIEDCLKKGLDSETEMVNGNTIGSRPAFAVFRACGGLLLLQWSWGCSVFLWTRFRVNYIYLFEFDPRIVSTPVQIVTEAVDNSLLFLSLMLLYYKAGMSSSPWIIPAGYFPLALVGITILKLIFPLKKRRPMWNSIFKVVTAPSHSPTFFQTYVGDIFTSLVRCFPDFAWTFFWLLNGDFTMNENDPLSIVGYWTNEFWYKNVLIPSITLLPLVIRFNQCLRKFFDSGDRLPHLANAGKYVLSQMVSLAGVFHPFYVAAGKVHTIHWYQIGWSTLFFGTALYGFWWDVYMDWGLGRKEYGFLGPRLIHPKKRVYYSVIFIDLVLRSMWLLGFVPTSAGFIFALPEYFALVQIVLELFRRTIWGLFRLEHEHRSNVSGYRRVDFVPLHFDTGHEHKYVDKKQKAGSSVLPELIFVVLVVAGFWIANIGTAAKMRSHTSSDL